MKNTIKNLVKAYSSKTASQQYADTSRKDDALELACIIYDIYKENKASGNIVNGQNNANQTKK